MTNYIDHGHIISQKMAQDSEKMMQEISYMDSSKFYGSVIHDEENGIIYKEGQGRFTRPKNLKNACFYN